MECSTAFERTVVSSTVAAEGLGFPLARKWERGHVGVEQAPARGLAATSGADEVLDQWPRTTASLATTVTAGTRRRRIKPMRQTHAHTFNCWAAAAICGRVTDG